ncbi:MAG: nicotinate (nicotinamide) nucleotide adenylyltransferase [Oscillospiraceae bacterium]|nr:nicotinate (nicotinamide) nucleotide adenylyltransferase [Oscillospiraceae bacterium]
MRILIFGGTFNPPHMGHLLAVGETAKSLGADRVFFVPTSIPPHKELAAVSPPAADRAAMLETVCPLLPNASVLDLELRREGRSYTAETLTELRSLYPEDELVFLMGTDMFLSILSWYEPETILSCANLAVFARERDRTAEIEAMADKLRREYGAGVYIITGRPLEVSSTVVRELLPRRQGRELVPESVYGYIIRKRLYGAKPELDWLREKAYAYLKPTRVPHVRGVEEEALRMAARWGADPGDAAEAAICHDITKALSQEEQLRMCEKYAIVTDELERANEKLLHARTGAALAADLFGLENDVALAIRFHTTGRPGMTTLEMITYLADYIEPGRNGFDGLEELRRACYEDLDRAMELGLRMSLSEVREKGAAAHGMTVEAHRWYVCSLRRRGLEPIRAAGIPDVV